MNIYPNKVAPIDIIEPKLRTADIFGKNLQQFKKRSDIKSDVNDIPLVFWLLTGYFRFNPEKFKTEGLFRITSSDIKLRVFELHMSQENYPYLSTIKDANLIANYLKRTMREMRSPLIPFDQYDEFTNGCKLIVHR